MAGYFTACCNEISRCCYDFYHAPFTKKNLLIIGGVVVGIIILAIIIAAASSSHKSGGTPFLDTYALVDGNNNFANSLKFLVENNLHNPSGLNFSHTNFKRNMTEYCVKQNANYTFCQTDFYKLVHGKVSTQVWAANVDCTSQFKDAVSRTLEQIDVIKRLIALPDKPKGILVTEPEGIKLGGGSSLGSIISIGGGHQLDMRTSIIRMYYDLGVRMMAPVGGNNCTPPWFLSDGNITAHGKVMIKQMNYLGIMIDMTGMTKEQMIQVLEVTEAPVLLSHSCVNFADKKHPLNVDAAVMAMLNEPQETAKYKSSMLMITLNPDQLIPCFSDPNINLTMSAVVGLFDSTVSTYKHIKIGIGSSFDSSNKTINGLEDVSKFPNLFSALAKKVGEKTAGRIAGKNFKDFFTQVKKVSQALQKKYSKDQDYLSSLEEMEPVNELGNMDKSCYSDPSYYKKPPPPTTPTTPATPSSSTSITTPSNKPTQPK